MQSENKKILLYKQKQILFFNEAFELLLFNLKLYMFNLKIIIINNSSY